MKGVYQTEKHIVIKWLRSTPDGKPNSFVYEYWKRNGYLVPIHSSSMSVPYLKQERIAEGKPKTIGQVVDASSANKFLSVRYRVHPFAATALAITYHASFATITSCQLATKYSTLVNYLNLNEAREYIDLTKPDEWIDSTKDKAILPHLSDWEESNSTCDKLREYIRHYDYMH